ncbi:MAG: PAS domain-containing protein [Bacteroidota bacterium]|nr:PAS domain-containing protein [Bacteroidota bacterium]
MTHTSETLNPATTYPASLFFDNNPLPCFIVNAASLQIINANKTCCKFYGYTAPELAALSFLDLDCSVDKLKLFQNFQRPLIDQVCKVERQHLKKNGDVAFVEIYTSVLKIDSKPVYQIAVVDVTEKELKNSLKSEITN